MKNTLFISDFGLVNALGATSTQVRDNLLLGSQHGFSLNKQLLNEGDIYVADVKVDMPDMAAYPVSFRSRNNQLALLAIEQIRAQVTEVVELVGRDRIAVVVGTSTSGIREGEQAMASLVDDAFPETFDYSVQEMFNLAEFVAEELALSGLAITLSTACSSSAKAFATAQEFVDNDLCDAVIVGGVDAICGMTINGFSALQSTSAGICQPSSVNRDGINIGEGAALCLLRKDAGQIKLLGVGESSDAHHMSAPHPEGEGAEVAMRRALAQGNTQANEVDYINLHGTATPKNDEMESMAVSRVFGDKTPCSSSKGMIGHTLGAAGATEVGLCWLLFNQDRLLAPHRWDNAVDESMPGLNWVDVGTKSDREITRCLSNSFAFGGNNVSVLIGL